VPIKRRFGQHRSKALVVEQASACNLGFSP
jgi:hypothetical protein